MERLELRKHRRLRAKFKSHFSIITAGVPGEGLVEDLSPGGCRVVSLDAVKLGDHLELCIFPDGSQAELFIEQARVCWTRDHEFGVAFTVAEQDVLTRLIQVWSALDVETTTQ